MHGSTQLGGTRPIPSSNLPKLSWRPWCIGRIRRTFFFRKARKACMRFNIPYLLLVVKMLFKNLIKSKILKKKIERRKDTSEPSSSKFYDRHLRGYCKYFTAIFIHWFIPFWKELDSILFSPFLCFLPVSVLVNKFSGESFQKQWPQTKYWRTVLESIISTFAMNIQTRCLSAVFIQAQRSDTS